MSRVLRGHLLTSSSIQIKLLTPFFPRTHDCMDNADVGNVDLDSEEEDFKDEEEGGDEEVNENIVLEYDGRYSV